MEILAQEMSYFIKSDLQVAIMNHGQQWNQKALFSPCNIYTRWVNRVFENEAQVPVIQSSHKDFV